MKARIGIASLALALLVVPFAAGCGGGMAERREEPRFEAERQLDEEEARLRAAQEELQQAGPACEGRCRASTSICDAAHRICALARDLPGQAPSARCERARLSCSEANDIVSECACTPAPAPADAGISRLQGPAPSTPRGSILSASARASGVGG